MNRKTITFLFVVFVLGTVNLVYAQSKSTLADEVDALFQRARDLQHKEDALIAVKAELDEKGNDIDFVNLSIKTGFTKYLRKMAENDTRIDTHDRQVNTHSNECSGTFSSRSWVSSCNQRKAVLDRAASKINKDRDYLYKEYDNWKEISATNKQNAENWNKENEKYKIECVELDRQIDSWQVWFTRLTNWPTFDDLVAREKLASICKYLPAEAGSDCLKRVWDGAR